MVVLMFRECQGESLGLGISSSGQADILWGHRDLIGFSVHASCSLSLSWLSGSFLKTLGFWPLLLGFSTHSAAPSGTPMTSWAMENSVRCWGITILGTQKAFHAFCSNLGDEWGCLRCQLFSRVSPPTGLPSLLGSPKPILSFCRLLQVSIQPDRWSEEVQMLFSQGPSF